MTVQECYEEMGQDYSEVVERFGTESLLKKFALRFVDEPSFGKLESELQSGDAEQAFRAAHTLKGICLNLGFSGLYEKSAALTEYLRNRTDVDGAEPLFEDVKQSYDTVIGLLKQL